MFVEMPIRLRYLIFDRLCCGLIVDGANPCLAKQNK